MKRGCCFGGYQYAHCLYDHQDLGKCHAHSQKEGCKYWREDKEPADYEKQLKSIADYARKSSDIVHKYDFDDLSNLFDEIVKMAEGGK